MSPVSPAQAIASARKNTFFEPVGYCLRWVRLRYGVDGLYDDATEAWEKAEFKHPVRSGAQVPRGAPIFWTGGSNGHGHIAIGTGNGNCWSTDAGGPTIAAKVNIDELGRRWSLLEIQGWTEDLNGVRVFDPRGVARSDGPAPKSRMAMKNLVVVDLPDVRELQRALKRRMPALTKDLVIDGCFGPQTQTAYKRWQHRCGFRGDSADGIPGKTTLHRLGFDVVG